jgi:glycosyltransferase involved in cell wall biosynthesis
LGAEGLHVTDGVHLLLGDTPAALAAHVSAVLERPDLGAALSTAGRRLTTETYDWRSCLTSLDELFDRVTHASARSRQPAGGVAS